MEEDWQTKKSSVRERAEMLFKTQDLCDCEFLVGSEKFRGCAFTDLYEPASFGLREKKSGWKTWLVSYSLNNDPKENGSFRLVVHNRQLPSHKLFLAMSSPVFYAMFYGEMAEKKSVEIKDIEPDAFKGMLQYIYTDCVDFQSCAHACTVYSAATKYLLPFLEEYCLKYLKENVSPDSACELFEFAEFHNDAEIEEACKEIFQSRTQEVLKSSGFLEAEFSTVLTIFEQDYLELESELVLFQGLQDWADAEAARQDVAAESLPVSQALSKIRFLLMTAEEFTGGPALSPLLTSEEKLAIAMNITKPGVIKLPYRINSMATPRYEVVAIEQTVPPLEWSLVREVSDTIVYPITRWVNPFPRKGFTVSRNIKLKGVKIASQGSTTSDESSPMYPENVTIVLKKDWSVKFSGAKYMQDTLYNSSITVLFHKPVLIEVGKKYWIIVQFDKGGNYKFMRDICNVYTMNNIKIELFEEFSPIIEFLFCDKAED